MNKSSLFHIYNILKNDSLAIPNITTQRLNKALGIAQKKEHERPYFTNMDSCTCPDSMQRHPIICKHRLAFMLTHPLETLHLRFTEQGPWENIS